MSNKAHTAEWKPEAPRLTRFDPAALAQLLREWREGDEQEQRETGEYLLRALDEARPERPALISPVVSDPARAGPSARKAHAD